MPLQVSGAFHTPFMTAARDRLRTALAEADPRDTEVPVVSNVDALAHDQRRRLGEPAVGPALEPGALEALPAHARRDAASPRFAELGPGGVLTGMAKRTVDRRPARSRSRPPRISTSCSSGSDAGARRRPRRAARGRAPLRRRASRRQPWRGHLHADRHRWRTGRHHRRRPCSATSATSRSARRSPACCRATSPSTPNASHPANPSPGCAVTDHDERGGPDQMPAVPTGHPRGGDHRVGHRPAREDRSPTTISSR